LLELKKLDPSNGDRYMRLLEEFLLDSRTLRNLFDYEFSGDLLRYWREVGTFCMKQCHRNVIQIV